MRCQETDGERKEERMRLKRENAWIAIHRNCKIQNIRLAAGPASNWN